MTGAAELYWDPFDIALDDEPYETWRRMRDEAPVYRNDRHDFWALSRFADVEAAHRDPQTFSSARGTVLEIMGPDLSRTGQMIFLDPPDHTSLRHLVSRAFTPRRVAQIEERVRELCAGLLDAQRGASEFDYLQDFGAKLPSMVISSLLGVPDEDQETFRHAIDRIFHIEPGVGMINDISINAGDRGQRLRRGAARGPAGRPRDDLLTALVEAEIVDDHGVVRRMTPQETVEFAMLLFVAGTETVGRFLGWAAVVLADHPDQRKELAADLCLIPKAVEELLRYEAPSPVQGRWTTRDVELHGQVIPEASKGAAAHRVGGPRRARVRRPRPLRHPPFRPPRLVRLRHPLLPRRRARPPRGSHRARGDAQALPDLGGRPRPSGPAAHQHGPGLCQGPRPCLSLSLRGGGSRGAVPVPDAVRVVQGRPGRRGAGGGGPHPPLLRHRAGGVA